MKLEDIQNAWERDSNIDRSELGEESLRIPQLHSKYFKIFSEERRVLRNMERSLHAFKVLKAEYYNGTISQEDLIDQDWQPYALKLLKSDIPQYVEADKQVRDMQGRLDIQIEKVELLESIIKNLPARGYQINAAISWEKFKVGA